jgi:hypothetical protein
MKKIICAIVCACMCACASKQTVAQPDVAYISPDDGKPPMPFPELTVRDRIVPPRAPGVVVDDQTKYLQSIIHIRNEFADEVLRLTMCVESSKESGSSIQACVDLKKQMCEIDQLIDARGDRHSKPYCWH